MSTRDVRIDWHGIPLLVEIDGGYKDFWVSVVNTVDRDWNLLDELPSSLLSKAAEDEILDAVRVVLDKEQKESASEPREPQYERDYDIRGGLYR